ncbi:hypothetical protein OSTOST_19090 [Ostertagia ostertagi]
MDVTQTNVSQKENLHCVLQETLVLMDEEQDTTLKNDEPAGQPQVVDVNIKKAIIEEEGQQQSAVCVEVPLKGDSVFASVEAVMFSLWYNRGGRQSMQPENVDTGIAYEPLVQKDLFDIAEQEAMIQEDEVGSPQSPQEAVALRVLENANVVRTRGVIENMQTENLSSVAIPVVPASENAEELQAGDSESGFSDRMTEGRASAKSSAVPRYKSPLSPIADVSRGGTISRESSVPRSFGSTASTPVYPNRRKYHMNDSEISFMINEIKVLNDEEQRKSKTPSHLEQLTENINQLEAEKAELSADLCALSAELDKYKEMSTVQENALAEVNKKLNEVEKAKEHAERTIADYEFIVTDLKQRHIKQKEDLHAKLIAQEEELEKFRVIVQSQEDLTYTSADLSAQLAAVNERLVMSEAARIAAEKRCEDLKEVYHVIQA